MSNQVNLWNSAFSPLMEGPWEITNVLSSKKKYGAVGPDFSVTANSIAI